LIAGLVKLATMKFVFDASPSNHAKLRSKRQRVFGSWSW